MSLFSRKRKEKQQNDRREDRQDKELPLKYHLSGIQGKGKKADQLDSWATVNDGDNSLAKEYGLMAIVVDGSCGREDAKAAGEEAVKTMVDCFERMDCTSEIPPQMQEAAGQVNRELFRRFGGEAAVSLTACMLFQNSLFYVNGGSCSLFLMRDQVLSRISSRSGLSREDCKQMSAVFSEDNAVADRVRKAFFEERSSGYFGMKTLSVDCMKKPFSLMPGDVLLLCSDGITETLSEEEIMESLKAESTEEICRSLSRKIQEHRKERQDNYTAIAIQASV